MDWLLMKGVSITVYYGNSYYDEEHDVEKMGYDWVHIGTEESKDHSVYDRFKHYIDHRLHRPQTIATQQQSK